MIRSGLILTGANKAWNGHPILAGIEDGILTSREVAELNLTNTELVVLSACQTGLGDDISTEGIYGLQRAFKLAGAQKLLLSLWSVDDRATQELMTHFYHYWIKRKMPIREAFAAAQNEMRSAYNLPYFWAGFILLE